MLGLAAVACEADAPAPGPTPTPHEVSVTAHLTIGRGPQPHYPPESEGLAGTYTVRNDGDDPLYIATERAHGQLADASMPEIDEAVWVSSGDEGAARLSKQVFDVPGDVLLSVPFVLEASRVEPGEEIEGAVYVPLPLVAELPPDGDHYVVGEDPYQDGASQAEICVQAAPVPDEDSRPGRLTNYTPNRQLACSDPMPLPQP